MGDTNETKLKEQNNVTFLLNREESAKKSRQYVSFKESFWKSFLISLFYRNKYKVVGI